MSTTRTTIDDAVAHYIAAWNETDAARRRALVAQTWTEDGTLCSRSCRSIASA